jgi:hypothetical protein
MDLPAIHTELDDLSMRMLELMQELLDAKLRLEQGRQRSVWQFTAY